MALHNLTKWLRWSNSPQAWGERAGTLSVVVAALLLWFFAAAAPLWLQVMGWTALGLLLAFFWRRGWVRLCGPVLFYDLLRNGRRSRLFAYRLCYLGLLFLVFYWMHSLWMPAYRFGEAMNRNQAAELSLLFFTTFMAVQLFVVAVLTPAFTADCITEEKERKTLEFILATDLRDREIIFGKLLSRMALIGLFILAGLPILSALQFMGGFSPLGLLAGFAITLLTMMSLASFSVLASVLARRTREALFLVYFIVLGYLGTTMLVQEQLQSNDGDWNSFPSTESWTSPLTVEDVLYTVRSGNPLYTVRGLFNSKGLNEDGIGPALGTYAAFHGVLSVLCIAGAIGLLRRAGLREPRPPRRGKARGWLRPRIGLQPMLWKEVWLEGRGKHRRLFTIVLGILVLLSVAPVFGMLTREFTGARSPFSWEHLGREVNEWVRVVGMLVALLAIAGVGVRAATSVRGEHDKETMTTLLTTPLSSEEILFAKWLGSLVGMRWFAVWLGLIWGLGVACNGLSPIAVPLLAGATLCYAAAAASVGLWFSVVCKTSLRAILQTLLLGVGLMVGHWLPWLCCVPMMRGPDKAMEGVFLLQGSLTPPAALAGYLPMSPADLDRAHHGGVWDSREMMCLAFFAAGAWLLLALFIGSRTNARFKLSGGRVDSILPRPSTGTKPASPIS